MDQARAVKARRDFDKRHAAEMHETDMRVKDTLPGVFPNEYQLKALNANRHKMLGELYRVFGVGEQENPAFVSFVDFFFELAASNRWRAAMWFFRRLNLLGDLFYSSPWTGRRLSFAQQSNAGLSDWYGGGNPLFGKIPMRQVLTVAKIDEVQGC
jgi:hypothetical protein